MTTMIKKRVAELEGAQLDWAVEKVLTGARLVHYDGHYVPMPLDCALPYSSDWCNGGPIIERERIRIGFAPKGHDDADTSFWAQCATFYTAFYARTTLIAAMRAFVASKLGDEVEVPE